MALAARRQVVAEKGKNLIAEYHQIFQDAAKAFDDECFSQVRQAPKLTPELEADIDAYETAARLPTEKELKKHVRAEFRKAEKLHPKWGKWFMGLPEPEPEEAGPEEKDNMGAIGEDGGQDSQDEEQELEELKAAFVDLLRRELEQDERKAKLEAEISEQLQVEAAWEKVNKATEACLAYRKAEDLGVAAATAPAARAQARGGVDRSRSGGGQGRAGQPRHAGAPRGSPKRAAGTQRPKRK